MAKATKQHKSRRLATKRRQANQAPPATVVQLVNLQRRHAIKKQELCDAVGAIIIGEKAKRANISIVIVDESGDPVIIWPDERHHLARSPPHRLLDARWRGA